MFDRLRQKLLELTRVPPQPTAPWGAPGSVQVFRAARNYYRLRQARWLLAQLGTVVGIVIAFGFLAELKEAIDVGPEVRAAAAPAAPATEPATAPAAAPAGGSEEAKSNARSINEGRREVVQQLASRTPWWVVPLVTLVEIGGLAFYVVQLPVTWLALRLEWELRWYVVTDRSLRLRSGIFTVRESTMSFANVQEVVVTQGPLQRLLGLADVRVRSAGGGDGGDKHGKHDSEDDSLHTGIFHGVSNAPEIRDLILARLKQFREAGLGDPDEAHGAAPAGSELVAVPDAAAPVVERGGEALAAARELLEEARAWRRALPGAN